jgi:site-specific recombinase XerD
MKAGKQDAIRRELARDPRLKSVNTQQAYWTNLQAFQRWRAGRPLSQALLEQYFGELRAAGKSPGTIVRAFYAIRWWLEKGAEIGDPAPDLPECEAGALLAGIEKAVAALLTPALPTPALPTPGPPATAPGVYSAHRGEALAESEIWELIKACLSDPSPAGVRDAALILLASSQPIRLEDISGLDLADCMQDGGFAGNLAVREQPDRMRAIQVDHFAFCALLDWLAVRGDRPGPLFCGVDRRGKLAFRYLSAEALRVILEKRLSQAGIRHLTWSDLRRS